MITTGTYIPAQGHFISLDFNPSAGIEIDKRRPAIVVSPAEFNSKTGLVLVCPITSTERGHNFEVKIPNGHKIQGVICTHQLRTLDWKARNAQLIEKAPISILREVQGRILAILDA